MQARCYTSLTMASICVLGLGYIGLPTASLFASRGHRVRGVDIDPARVALLQNGHLPIDEPGLHVLVQGALGSGLLEVATTPDEADVFIIAVPTPATPQHHADLSHVKAATEAIVPFLRSGNLVILESTVPPGTTRDLLKPLLEASGRRIGEDLFLAHCPERVLPGRILTELITNDRVVGGLTPRCSEQAQAIYQGVIEGEVYLTDATTAETVKLMENTYRDVNVALANELARLSDRVGIDAWEVIQLANHHPRVHLHQPGPGVGGHCISVDPWFLVEAAPHETHLVRVARERNDDMPRYVAHSLMAWLKVPGPPTVTLLGVTYKGNVDDTRESPATHVAHALQEEGATVKAHDPRVTHWDGGPLFDLETACRDSDAVLLLADHPEFLQLAPDLIAPMMRRKNLFDTRHFLNVELWRQAGFEVKRLGAHR